MEKKGKFDDGFDSSEELIEDEDNIREEDKEEDSEEVNPLEELQKEKEKLKDDFLRALADMENLKKRCANEIEKNNKYAISNFAKALLSVADNLQRAIEAIKTGGVGEGVGNLLKGVELTQDELTKVFAKFGVKKMDIIGTIFNPNYHQVIQEVIDNEKENGTIVAELQTGYMIEDRILREAMVVVTKKE